MNKFIVVSGLLLAILTVASVGQISCAPVAGNVQLQWTSPMGTTDVAVSKDGNYVAAANETGLYYFASTSSTPLWWYPENGEVEDFLSVAISATGECVIAGNNSNGALYYFGGSTTRSGLQASDDFTWRSVNFWGWPTSDVEAGTIDISDNGEYVAVGGTGESLYYFADCTSKSGSSTNWDWIIGSMGYVHALDMSSDGRYVVAAGPQSLSGPTGIVQFVKDANVFPYPTGWTWYARMTDSIEDIQDVAVSDDGYAVSAVSGLFITTLYYWAGASGLSGDPAATWKSTFPYACVDMSADGDQVVAGKPLPEPCGIHYWSNARSLSGENILETWNRHEGEYVPDIAISEDGETIAAVATKWVDDTREYWAYFYNSNGVSLGEAELDSECTRISMSANGGTVAAGGAAFDSLYVFRMSLQTVGGEVVPVDFLWLLAPYLLYGLIIVVAAAGIVRAKRRFL